MTSPSAGPVMLAATSSSIASPCDLRSSVTRPMPSPIALAGDIEVKRWPSTSNGTARNRQRAEQAERQLRAPGADHAGERDDLAGIGARSRHPAPGRRPRAFRCAAPAVALVAAARFGGKSSPSSRPTIIEIRRSRVTSGDVVGADQFAVLQHGDAIADREYFFEAMRDENHRDAAVAQPPQPIEQQRRPRARRSQRSARRAPAASPRAPSRGRSRPFAGRRPTATPRWREDRARRRAAAATRWLRAASARWSTMPNRLRRSWPTKMFSATDNCGNSANS